MGCMIKKAPLLLCVPGRQCFKALVGKIKLYSNEPPGRTTWNTQLSNCPNYCENLYSTKEKLPAEDPAESDTSKNGNSLVPLLRPMVSPYQPLHHCWTQ